MIALRFNKSDQLGHPAQMNFSPNGRSPDLRLLVVCTFPDFYPVAHAAHPNAYSCGAVMELQWMRTMFPFKSLADCLRYRLVMAALEQFARHSSKKIPYEQKS